MVHDNAPANPMTDTAGPVQTQGKDLLRPIIGIENRTPQEVFDIMCDRFRAAPDHTDRIARRMGAKFVPASLSNPSQDGEPVAWMYRTIHGEDAYFSETRNETLVANLAPNGEWTETPLYTSPQSGEVERLREALEPFAAVLDEYDPDDEDDATPATLVVGSVTDYSLTLGDLRAASAALSLAKEGGER